MTQQLFPLENPLITIFWLFTSKDLVQLPDIVPPVVVAL